MLHPSTKKLIDRLAEMTFQRKIDWVSGEREDSLVYDTEGYRVLLEGDPVTLVLTDALGRELESATPTDLADTKNSDGVTYQQAIADMRKEAMRIARGTELAISAVLQGLDDDVEPVSDPQTFETETLTPTEAERAAPEPDMVEDIADEATAISYDDTTDVPDIGKAVANLADQVNGVTPLETADETREPVTELTTAAPEPDPEVSASWQEESLALEDEPEVVPDTIEADAATNTEPAPERTETPEPARPNISTMGGFGDLSAYKQTSVAGAVVNDEAIQEAAEKGLADSSAPISPPTLEPVDASPPPSVPQATAPTSDMPADIQNLLNDVTAPVASQATPDLALDNEPDTPAPQEPADKLSSVDHKPGETLSLSGLTSGLGLGPVTAGTARAVDDMPTSPSTAQQETHQQTPDTVVTTVEETNTPAEASQPPVSTANSETSDHPDENGEPEAPKKPANSRFNPWM